MVRRQSAAPNHAGLIEYFSPETPEVFLPFKILQHSRGRLSTFSFFFQEFLVYATIPAGMVGVLLRKMTDYRVFSQRLEITNGRRQIAKHDHGKEWEGNNNEWIVTEG